MNNQPASSIEEKVRLATLTPIPRPEFTDDLWRQIASRPRHQPENSIGFVRLFQRHALSAIIVILIVSLGIIVIGPQKVAAAFRSLFGYVPNIGFVENAGSIRVVDGPVQVERDGIVITIVGGMADAQGFHVNLRIDGLPTGKSFQHPSTRGSEDHPYLSLPSGQRLKLLSGLSSRGNVTTTQYFFEAVPEGSDEVMLVLPDFPGIEIGQAMDDWQIPLHLRLPTDQDAITPSVKVQMTSETRNGVRLVLEEFAQDSEQTMLKVRVDTGDPWISPMNEWWTQLTLTDTSGKIYPLTDITTVEPDNVSVRVLKTTALTGSEQLYLGLAKVDLSIGFLVADNAPGFRFNPGQNPQIGQRWDLNQTIDTKRFQLHFTQVALIEDQDGQILLRFTLDPQPGLSTLLLGCGVQETCSGSSASVWNGTGPLHTNLAFKEIPNRPIRVHVATLMVTAEGPWQVNWQPLPLSPEALAQPTATPVPTLIPPTPTPTVAIQQSVAAEILPLLEQGFTELYGQPGWVHIVSENIEPDYSGFLLGPKHTIGEYWQYVDADGILTQYALIVRDPDGGVWQKIARVGRRQVNFTTGTAVDDPALEIKAQHETLPETILQAEAGTKVIREEVLLDQRPCLLIILRTAFDPPIEITSIPQRVARADNKTWIDQETGKILQKEIVYGLEDGTDYVLQTLRHITIERVDTPPQEILDMLDQVLP